MATDESQAAITILVTDTGDGWDTEIHFEPSPMDSDMVFHGIASLIHGVAIQTDYGLEKTIEVLTKMVVECRSEIEEDKDGE